jgi:hypothetical protein
VVRAVVPCMVVTVVAGTGPMCPLQASRLVGAVPVSSYMPYIPRPSNMMPTSVECPVAVVEYSQVSP